MPVTSNDLSERESEILRLVATGASNKEIAQQLNLSANTVKVHLRNIFAKIGVVSRTEAAMYAVSNGLVKGVALPVEKVEPKVMADDTDVKPETAVPEDVFILTPVSAPVLVQNVAPQAARRSAWPWVIGLVLLLAVVSLGIYYWWATGQAAVPAAVAMPTLSTDSRWAVLAAMPTARSDLAVVVFENQVYAIAGQGAAGSLGTVELYNPLDNSWTGLADKPTAVSEVGAAVLGGKIYVPGGRLASGEMTAALEIYNPNTNTWATGKSLPQAISAYALAAFEGQLYVFGGWDGKSYLDVVYAYSPEVDRWERMASMPTRRAFAGATVAGRAIYVVGGYDGKKALAVNEMFQPDALSGENPWVSRRAMPMGLYATGVAGLADLIHVVGGSSDGSREQVSLQYQPLVDEWGAFESLPQGPLTHFGMTSLGGYLYVVGGVFEGHVTGKNFSYQAIYSVGLPIIR